MSTLPLPPTHPTLPSPDPEPKPQNSELPSPLDALSLDDLFDRLTASPRIDVLLSNFIAEGIHLTNAQLQEFLLSDRCHHHLILREHLTRFQAKIFAQNEVHAALHTLHELTRHTQNPIAQRLAATQLLELANIHPQEKPATVIRHEITHQTPPPPPLPTLPLPLTLTPTPNPTPTPPPALTPSPTPPIPRSPNDSTPNPTTLKFPPPFPNAKLPSPSTQETPVRHFPILPPLLLLLATLLLSAVARADSVNVDGNKYEGTIVGIKSGRLAITIRNTEHEYDLDKIADVVIDAAPKFADAEKARDTDPKAAAALYKQVIPALNKPELKQFAQWRAIAPTDADNRWTEAVQLFLDVYRASPTDFIYKSRPTHMPNAGSAMLAESADKVAAAAKAAKSDDVRKNLKLFLLDIYTKAGNTDAANRLAREISTGIAEDAAPPKPAENPIAASGSAAVTEIETALRSKNYDAALKQADAQLATATGDTAVQLFTLKAQAYEAQNNLEGALAALLRIPAHYPDSPAAPAALLHAADLDKKLNHPAAAAALTTELLEKFPSSPEALSARQK